MGNEFKLGDVVLDLSHYSGKDYYSDGEIESRLLKLCMENPSGEYGELIERSADWPIFYHLSHLRANVVEWLPIREGDRVLEVGSGCGALTGTLARKAGSVDCIELSKKRSEINGVRNNTYGNVRIHVGNFEDIEPELPGDYQWILLIGVLEYAGGFLSGENPYLAMLSLLRGHLASGGRLVVAIENRLGLKYLAGCREDHLGTFFSGVEGYPGEKNVRTFSRRALASLLNRAGFAQQHWYYPYPDYKIAIDIFSDSFLPGAEELQDNVWNMDRERLLLFNEKNASRALLEDGMYQDFANSFLVVTGPSPEQVYIRYSNDRAPEFQIRTEVVRDSRGGLFVRKSPLREEAQAHVLGMADSYAALKERYAASKLHVCECFPQGDSVAFPFVQGISLSALFDQLLEKEDLEGFGKLFADYIRIIGTQEEYPVSDYDMAFSNILVEQDQWTLIDYEWTYGQQIPASHLAYRALRDYLLSDRKRKKVPVDALMKALGIDKETAAQLVSEEAEFQKYVTGGRLSLVELREKIGKRVRVPAELEKEG
ncbi:MAG: class I SAM-dependent methyltransferase, partial [Lachnospiraceae bacterium]|nr:class I SAM-dependent methyltransferase [Lachnospiraceae bacterium]